MGAPRLLGFVQEYRMGFRCGFPDDYGDAGLDDSGFLGSYLCQCVSEELRVVRADVGDEAQGLAG